MKGTESLSHHKGHWAYWIGLVVFALACSFCYGRSLEKNYGVSENSIVATPVGYEKNVTLCDGEVVELYSDTLSREEVTNCHAVLFCVMSPPAQRGKRFLFRHSGCTCYMCRLPSSVTNLYQIGKFYLFESPHTVSNILLSAYEVHAHSPELKMERDWGRLLYCNIKDVDARLRELERSVEEDQALIKEYRARLQQIPNERSQRKARHELKCDIMRIEQRLTNAIPHARAELLERRKWLSDERTDTETREIAGRCEAEAWVRRRLKEILLPELALPPSATLLDAVEHFRLVAKEAGEREGTYGLSFIVNLAGGCEEAPVVPTIRARNISLCEALNLVCRLTGYRFEVDGGLVYVMPRGHD